MIGKRTYNDLLRDGYIHDKHRNILVLRQIDSDIPDIGVEPLQPTAYQSFKNEIVKNSGKMANWLWKLIQNRSTVNDIAD